MEYGGYLAWADGSCEPSPSDPFEVYDYETAKRHVLADVLQRGVKYATAGQDKDSIHYRLVPVYTGLEYLLEPRVMIFCETLEGGIVPCSAWPEDCQDDDEKSPLNHRHGFKNNDRVEPNYTLSSYTPAVAAGLIAAQLRHEMETGEKGYRYFTVPVTAAADIHLPYPLHRAADPAAGAFQSESIGAMAHEPVSAKIGNLADVKKFVHQTKH